MPVARFKPFGLNQPLAYGLWSLCFAARKLSVNRYLLLVQHFPSKCVETNNQ